MFSNLPAFNKATFGALSIPFAQSVAEHLTTIAMYAVSLIGLDLPPEVRTALNTLIGMAISGLVIAVSANMPKTIESAPERRINVLTDIADHGKP